MARYTAAYSGLLRGLTEVSRLTDLARESEKKDPLGLWDQTNALCRAAVVLLCAHMEAYVRGLAEVALDRISNRQVGRSHLPPRFFYHISKDRLLKLREQNDPDNIAKSVFDFLQNDSAYWSWTGHFPAPPPADRFCKGFADPKVDKVRGFLRRIGYDTFKPDLRKTLRADFVTTTNMVDHLVDTRHRIAHGDASATKTPSDVAALATNVQRFCRVTDSVFAAWCKSHLCTIR